MERFFLWQPLCPSLKAQLSGISADAFSMSLFAILGCIVIYGELAHQLRQIRLRRLLRAQEYRLPF